MKKAALILILSFSFLSVGVRAVNAAAYLTVSPTSGSYDVDGTFTVTLGVNSGGETIGGVDGVGTYDSSKLDLVSISQASDMVFASSEDGGSCTIDKTAADGKFSFSCYSNSTVGDRAVSGNLITINFKGTSTGTASLNYTCASGSTTDSNIVKSSTVTDVITCGSNQSGSYTISEGDGDSSDDEETTSTPTPTSTTSSELPQTGSVGVTVGLVAFGLVSLISAVFLKFL
ncbi:MAG: cohesin domain-containing protein [Candidatus Shapirobacteria bacterium]|nr:cohesin domain-containing protein [Candidatus Shapirobacteria bacterium]